MDVVKLGELSAIVRRLELLEFFERLAAKVAAIYEKQNSAGVREFDEPVRRVDGGEGFAGTGRHLNQGTRMIASQRGFEVMDRGGLDLPELAVHERRKGTQAPSELRVLIDPFKKRLRPMEREHFAASGVWIESIRESGFDAGALIDERERATICG